MSKDQPEFLRGWRVDTAGILCPDSRNKFKKKLAYHTEQRLAVLSWLTKTLKYELVLKEKFPYELVEFYASLSAAKFPNIRKMAQKMLVLFGSVHVCEQTFTVMKTNKAPHRSQLSNELSSVLRITTSKLTPDFDALAKNNDKQHCSY